MLSIGENSATMQGMVRLRIAPSPTGYPHIGTVYQALFDYAYAKKNKGTFLIRIEDTDRARLVVDAEEKIYQAIDWFGLVEDESTRKGGPYAPYRQSERLPLYKEKAEALVSTGHAYYCFCSKDRLATIHLQQQKEKKPMMYDKHCRDLSETDIQKQKTDATQWVIRLKVPLHTTITARDGLRGDITFQSDLIEDTILLKSDGFPTYHLASVVDDHAMEITHVLRGEEWLSSLPKHVLLYQAFGWDAPLFFHTPVLRNPDKSKLSKRQGHTDVLWYKEEGYLPEAMLNYLALMGWSHPEEKEVFSLDEFIAVVDLSDIKPIGPIFDLKKLMWMNGVYIRQFSLEQLAKKLCSFDTQNMMLAQKDNHTFLKLVSLAQSRMQTLKEFSALTQFFIVAPKLELSSEEKALAERLYKACEEITEWNTENILSVLKQILQEKSMKMSVLYTLFTGNSHGLPLPDMLVLLTKQTTLARLRNML